MAENLKQTPVTAPGVKTADHSNPNNTAAATKANDHEAPGAAASKKPMTADEYAASKDEWDIEVENLGKIAYSVYEDKFEIEEKLHWAFEDPSDRVGLNINALIAGRKVGSSKLISAGAASYVNPILCNQLTKEKTFLRTLSPEQIKNARVRSNVFEMIKGGIFQNRAAMKMANMDAILNFLITEPNSFGPTNSHKEEPLYFADLCAGPGGFSEYFLWRKKWHCKGFGFTLRGGEHDFDLENFITGTENFEPHYGELGDGNVLNPDNVSSFVDFVLQNTWQKGVHFVTADGGISVNGNEGLQEILTQDLLLAQICMALPLIRSGGHFICKTFDLFTNFTVGLVYLLYKCFRKLSIHKPTTSRPANSERYIICLHKREGTKNVEMYLFESQKLLWKNKFQKGAKGGGGAADYVPEFVPQDIMTKGDPAFWKYIRNSNNRLAIRQILGLQKLAAYVQDPSMFDPRQQEVKEQSLAYWKIDLKWVKELPDFPETRFDALKGNCPLPSLDKAEVDLSNAMLAKIGSPFDWRVVVVGGHERKRGIFFGFGGERNYFFDHQVWRIVQVKFHLGKDTIVFGEIVDELAENAETSNKAFHIIDAIYLGGQDIRALHYQERHALCTSFAKAMNKKSRTDLVPVRTKKFMRLECISEFFQNLKYKALVKSCGEYSPDNTLELHPDDQVAIKPTGLLFLKITVEPWTMAFCVSSKRKYFSNKMSFRSQYHYPLESCADFRYTFQNRLIWHFDEKEFVDVSVPNGNIKAKDLVKFVGEQVGAFTTP